MTRKSIKHRTMHTIRNCMTSSERDRLLNGPIKQMIDEDPAFLYEIISVIRKEKNRRVKRQFSNFLHECNPNITKFYSSIEA